MKARRSIKPPKPLPAAQVAALAKKVVARRAPTSAPVTPALRARLLDAATTVPEARSPRACAALPSGHPARREGDETRKQADGDCAAEPAAPVARVERHHPGGLVSLARRRACPVRTVRAAEMNAWSARRDNRARQDHIGAPGAPRVP